MPYEPQWMSGTEALLHIVQVEGCTIPEAIEQLKTAIEDRQVDGARASPPHQLIRRVKEITPSGEAKGSKGFGFSVPDAGPLPFRVKREHVLRIWPIRPDASVPTAAKPETEGSQVTSRRRPVYDPIKEAINAMWPDGIPLDLSAKERNWEIREWLISKGRRVTTEDRSFAKAIRRVVNDIPLM